ncbi:unnamed protein product [Mycena citricolor]|uniref:Checkpoint protein n=1 Tax=Mycena citricolor TaxID=2018698 RepID=A0AAD2Q7Z3_9AGAR|nr:unnamed protein product [Mycena citricolor]CAK5284202.1 unnamed protein product [Mycena citricolor]
MRFRATIENVNAFFRIIQAVEKLQKKCIMKFTEEVMCIICNSEDNEGGIQVWSQITVLSLFDSYRIQSNAANVITMSLSSEALLATLRSASTSSNSTHETQEVVMKLAKKNDVAVLSFEITGVSRQGRKVRVSYDVRIEVMKPADVENLREPLCPEPDVNIVLPPLQKLRPIVERLRSMSDYLLVRANNSGCLNLSVQTDSVSVDTEWKNCTITPRAAANSQDPEPIEKDPVEMFPVTVTTRSFLKFLNSHVVSTTTIACICRNHCMILYVYLGDRSDAGGVLTFYIPGQDLGND